MPPPSPPATPVRIDRAPPFDVVGFGFNTLDHLCVVPHLPGLDTKLRMTTYARQAGGQIPTALIALQRWGLRTAYVGPIGDDDGGRRQQDSLQQEGVDLTGARLRPGVGSQTSVIMIDQVSGERTVVWNRPDGLALPPEELDRHALTAGRVLFMDADDTDTAIVAAGWAKAAGVRVALDVDAPGPRTAELLRLTDVAIVSAHFPQRLTGLAALRPALRRMQRMGPSFAAVTLGAGGALACADGRLHYTPAFRVRAVDTTAAGDLFHAGGIYGILRGWPVAQTLRFAAAAAALECERLGGRAAIPPLATILALASLPAG